MLFRTLITRSDRTRLPGFARGLFVLVLALVVAGCVESGTNIIGVVDGASSPTREPLTVQHVFFATTRARSDDPSVFFSGERSSVLSLG